jgi:hypothetical protein
MLSWITTVNPRASVQNSSRTEMSNEMLVSASQVRRAPASLASSPSRASIPAKKFETFRCSSITPLGRPVDPEVKIT